MPENVNLRIDWATNEAAKYAVKYWHYSQCMPAGGTVKVGAWENGCFIGVIVFARGATPNLGNPYGLLQDQCVELARVALKMHISPVSRVVAVALKFLKKSNPNLRMVVSFADQSQGHHGGIYQAGNWIYTGQSGSAKFYKIKGKLTHPRSIGSRGFTQNINGAKQLDRNATIVIVPGKHRYLMPLNSEIRSKVMNMAKPYPKRSKQAMAGTTSTAAG